MFQTAYRDTQISNKTKRKMTDLFSSLLDSDDSKIRNISLLRGMIPDGWKETVYEYSDKYMVDLSINQYMPQAIEVSITDKVRKEFGAENVICSLARNTMDNSFIRFFLKKANYSD